MGLYSLVLNYHILEVCNPVEAKNNLSKALTSPSVRLTNLHLQGWLDVGRQEHSPIRARAQCGFSVLWDQVLVLFSGQELDPIADNGQEHGTIADLINIYKVSINCTCTMNFNCCRCEKFMKDSGS